MMSPSDEERIVAMVDSFTKTVARNFSRNLKGDKRDFENTLPMKFQKEGHL